VVDAVRCAIEVQSGSAERNAGLPPERRIEFRVGIHLGDVVEEADGDLMGDGVNIAARLEGAAKPGGICLSEDAYRQVKSRLELRVHDLGVVSLKNIAESVRAYALEVGPAAQLTPVKAASPTRRRFGLRRPQRDRNPLPSLPCKQFCNRWTGIVPPTAAKVNSLAGAAPKEAIRSYGRAQKLNLKSQVFLIASYANRGRNGRGGGQHAGAGVAEEEKPKFSVKTSLLFKNQPHEGSRQRSSVQRDALVSSGLPLWTCAGAAWPETSAPS
jgi:hypothetical protein